MKWVLDIFGVLLAIMGTIWILQGTGVYPVGFMAYQIKYTYAGIVVEVIAVLLFIIANRRGRKLPPSP